MAGTQSSFACYSQVILHRVCFDWRVDTVYCYFQAPVSRMYRRRGYRLFRPRYDWTMIRDQVGESAYGNAVGWKYFRFTCVPKLWALLNFTHVILRLQYLEIEVKNPRTHIENEKAQYTDYEIELKVRQEIFLKAKFTRSTEFLTSEDSSF